MTGTRRSSGQGGPTTRALARSLVELAGVVLPVECGGCGVPDVSLCPACAEVLAGPARRVAADTWAVAPYTGAVRHLVVAWKDRGRHDLTRPLAGALADAVVALLDDVGPPSVAAAAGPPSGVVLLVPVPSRRSARGRRGADVVRRLAVGAARRARARGAPVRVLPALGLGRSVADQAGLGRTGRARNVAGAMRLRVGAGRSVVGRACVVVDDVVTTGASLHEAMRVLAAAGARPLGGAVACATPLRRGLSDPAHLH